ncbi:hypothetical protein HDR66_02670 [bacterium]|nr:hypothetical protein [bacterium]
MLFRKKRIKAQEDGNIYPENISGLIISVHGKNNTIEIDNKSAFFASAIDINANNSHIHIKNVKYLRNLIIHVYNGDNQNIVIDDGTSIEGAHIYLCGYASECHIGAECMLANNIQIWTADGHSVIDMKTQHVINATPCKVTIGDRTWVAQDAKLLKGAKIPPDTIVAASSIVTKEFIESHTIIGGNPAKILRQDICWDRRDPFEYRGTL